jgi:hypothetical protein
MTIVSDKDLAALAATATTTGSTSLLEVEFEAFMYMLRLGPSVLAWPRVAAYVARLSEEQLQQAVTRLIRSSPSNDTPWKPNEIRSLRGMRDARPPE